MYLGLSTARNHVLILLTCVLLLQTNFGLEACKKDPTEVGAGLSWLMRWRCDGLHLHGLRSCRHAAVMQFKLRSCHTRPPALLMCWMRAGGVSICKPKLSYVSLPLQVSSYIVKAKTLADEQARMLASGQVTQQQMLSSAQQAGQGLPVLQAGSGAFMHAQAAGIWLQQASTPAQQQQLVLVPASSCSNGPSSGSNASSTLQYVLAAPVAAPQQQPEHQPYHQQQQQRCFVSGFVSTDMSAQGSPGQLQAHAAFHADSLAGQAFHSMTAAPAVSAGSGVLSAQPGMHAGSLLQESAGSSAMLAGADNILQHASTWQMPPQHQQQQAGYMQEGRPGYLVYMPPAEQQQQSQPQLLLHSNSGTGSAFGSSVNWHNSSPHKLQHMGMAAAPSFGAAQQIGTSPVGSLEEQLGGLSLGGLSLGFTEGTAVSAGQHHQLLQLTAGFPAPSDQQPILL